MAGDKRGTISTYLSETTTNSDLLDLAGHLRSLSGLSLRNVFYPSSKKMYYFSHLCSVLGPKTPFVAAYLRWCGIFCHVLPLTVQFLAYYHINKRAIISPFLTRGYAQAYHELLQGQGYANESLARS